MSAAVKRNGSWDSPGDESFVYGAGVMGETKRCSWELQGKGSPVPGVQVERSPSTQDTEFGLNNH